MIDFCEEHGHIRETLGKMLANSEAQSKGLMSLREDMNRAVNALTKATEIMNREQLVKTIGKISIWAITVLGGYFVIRWIEGYFIK